MRRVLDPDVVTAAESPPDKTPLLSVEGLKVEFATGRGTVRAVDGVSWSVAAGDLQCSRW